MSRGVPVDEVAPGLPLGELFATFRYAVTAGHVERFVVGSGDTTGPWQSGLACSGALPDGTPAPPAYFIALDPYERGDLGIDAPLDRLGFRSTGGKNPWNEVTYRRPIRVGDTITVEVTFVDVFEKDGASGRMLFIGPPWDLSKTAASVLTPPPTHGEHTDEVVAEIGLTEDDSAAFQATQVI